MLVVKIIEKEKNEKGKRKLFRKKDDAVNSRGIKRESLLIKGRQVVIAEIPLCMTEDKEIKRLLNAYKGRVLVSERYSHLPVFEDSLFCGEDYYKRALLSSLVNQIKMINKEWRTALVKMENFVGYNELSDLVRVTKTVAFDTLKNNSFYKFKESCYYEYGAVVNIKDEKNKENFDVFLNLDELDSSGKLMITVKGKDFLLYPDAAYYTKNTELKILYDMGISDKILCAAFGNNN